MERKQPRSLSQGNEPCIFLTQWAESKKCFFDKIELIHLQCETLIKLRLFSKEIEDILYKSIETELFHRSEYAIIKNCCLSGQFLELKIYPHYSKELIEYVCNFFTDLFTKDHHYLEKKQPAKRKHAHEATEEIAIQTPDILAPNPKYWVSKIVNAATKQNELKTNPLASENLLSYCLNKKGIFFLSEDPNTAMDQLIKGTSYWLHLIEFKEAYGPFSVVTTELEQEKYIKSATNIVKPIVSEHLLLAHATKHHCVGGK
jgi:hypothetical protein